MFFERALDSVLHYNESPASCIKSTNAAINQRAMQSSSEAHQLLIVQAWGSNDEHKRASAVAAAPGRPLNEPCH